MKSRIAGGGVVAAMLMCILCCGSSQGGSINVTEPGPLTSPATSAAPASLEQELQPGIDATAARTDAAPQTNRLDPPGRLDEGTYPRSWLFGLTD
jgi:ABC-type phosphate/phosphonate transport system substrate-binding protein